MGRNLRGSRSLLGVMLIVGPMTLFSGKGYSVDSEQLMGPFEPFERLSQAILTAPTERALMDLRAKFNEQLPVASTEYAPKAIDVLIDHRLSELQETRWQRGGADDEIDPKQLTALLDQFAAAYDVGDLPQFLALFAEDAQSNNQSGLQKIEQSYGELFNKTKDRRMVIRDMTWKRYADRASGRGSFEVRLSKQGKPKSYTGKIVLGVNQRHNQLRISELYYSACELDTL